MAEDALTAVAMRNNFTRDGQRRTIIALLISILSISLWLRFDVYRHAILLRQNFCNEY